jgi:hypothetical protein
LAELHHNINVSNAVRPSLPKDEAGGGNGGSGIGAGGTSSSTSSDAAAGSSSPTLLQGQRAVARGLSNDDNWLQPEKSSIIKEARCLRNLCPVMLLDPIPATEIEASTPIQQRASRTTLLLLLPPLIMAPH